MKRRLATIAKKVVAVVGAAAVIAAMVTSMSRYDNDGPYFNGYGTTQQ